MKQKMYFKDRIDAGKKLARLFAHINNKDIVVYALPRGGVVVAAEIAKTIHVPLDLIITRKIGHPNQQEYAIGVVAENGHSIFNKEEVLEISKGYIKEEMEKQRLEAKRRREVYLGKKKLIPCKGKVAILVDDGIATGLTIKAAIKELKIHYKPGKIIVAVPIIPKNIADELKIDGEEIIAINITEDFLGGVGAYYKNFSPVEDQDIIKIMSMNFS